MKRIFLTQILVKHVRHLKNISIPLSEEEPKHLMLTGKNGSGKTSVIKALSNYLNFLMTVNDAANLPDGSLLTGLDEKDVRESIQIKLNQPITYLEEKLLNGQLILAYYEDQRIFQADRPEHVEKVKLKGKYNITDGPGQLFVKFLLDLKVTEALARNNGNDQKAEQIKTWFLNFEELLKSIFDDHTIKLVFDEDTFSFYIKEDHRELFDFYSLSSGFAAVLDIVLDLMLRMESYANRKFDFTMPGIVLIDEVETHLHIEMQKSIMTLLTTLFPNIQFIISTHSPFILNSIENCVVYDLEKNIRMENLSGYPAEGIVEGYFESESYSHCLIKKVERYKELININFPTEEERIERAKLYVDLKQLPPDLAKEAKAAFDQIESCRRGHG